MNEKHSEINVAFSDFFRVPAGLDRAASVALRTGIEGTLQLVLTQDQQIGWIKGVFPDPCQEKQVTSQPDERPYYLGRPTYRNADTPECRRIYSATHEVLPGNPILDLNCKEAPCIGVFRNDPLEMQRTVQPGVLG